MPRRNKRARQSAGAVEQGRKKKVEAAVQEEQRRKEKAKLLIEQETKKAEAALQEEQRRIEEETKKAEAAVQEEQRRKENAKLLIEQEGFRKWEADKNKVIQVFSNLNFDDEKRTYKWSGGMIRKRFRDEEEAQQPKKKRRVSRTAAVTANFRLGTTVVTDRKTKAEVENGVLKNQLNIKDEENQKLRSANKELLLKVNTLNQKKLKKTKHDSNAIHRLGQKNKKLEEEKSLLEALLDSPEFRLQAAIQHARDMRTGSAGGKGYSVHFKEAFADCAVGAKSYRALGNQYHKFFKLFFGQQAPDALQPPHRSTAAEWVKVRAWFVNEVWLQRLRGKPFCLLMDGSKRGIVYMYVIFPLRC
jgi:hypothetical protein